MIAESTTTSDYWNRKLAYLKGLKAPTQAQQLLILLAEKPDRTAEDDKQLTVLLRAERAAERARAAQLQAAKLLGQRNLDRSRGFSSRLLHSFQNNLRRSRPLPATVQRFYALAGGVTPVQPLSAIVPWQKTNKMGMLPSTLKQELAPLRDPVWRAAHVNYSARIQTVHPDTNPRFHRLLDQFEARIGCLVLANTNEFCEF